MNFELFPPLQRAWLVALWFLWSAFLFGGLILGSPHENRRMPRWTRMASSWTLVVAGWSWWLFLQHTEVGLYAFWIALGMTFGGLGDLFLAELLGIKGTRAVIAGIGAFGVGHLAYIGAILYGAKRFLTPSMMQFGQVLMLFWIIALIGWWGMVMRGQKHRHVVHWAALPYALLLATTAGLAAGMASQSMAFWPLAAGAFLFLVSDLILAGALFGGLKWPYMHDIVWMAYGPGQMLIVYSIGVVYMQTL